MEPAGGPGANSVAAAGVYTSSTPSSSGWSCCSFIASSPSSQWSCSSAPYKSPLGDIPSIISGILIPPLMPSISSIVSFPKTYSSIHAMRNTIAPLPVPSPPLSRSCLSTLTSSPKTAIPAASTRSCDALLMGAEQRCTSVRNRSVRTYTGCSDIHCGSASARARWSRMFVRRW